MAGQCRRVASICIGAFFPADTGLLKGKHATNLWRHVASLRSHYPRVRIDAEPLFVQDGNVWTATGTNAGIDLSLSMVEQDFGVMIARTTARMMVVNLRRPGGQMQFAGSIELEPTNPRLRKALDQARTHLQSPLGIEELAKIA